MLAHPNGQFRQHDYTKGINYYYCYYSVIYYYY